MASSKVNEKEKFNNTYGTTQRIREKRVKLNSVGYDCEEEESL